MTDTTAEITKESDFLNSVIVLCDDLDENGVTTDQQLCAVSDEARRRLRALRAALRHEAKP